MTSFPQDVGGAVEAYAAYLNAPRGILDHEEQLLFDEDMARARAAMERAWLESTPVQNSMRADPISPPRHLHRIAPALGALVRGARRALVRA
jgi:hypothetical protein